MGSGAVGGGGALDWASPGPSQIMGAAVPSAGSAAAWWGSDGGDLLTKPSRHALITAMVAACSQSHAL
eukprot:4469951-Pyramimonas_sp.AAC.1